MDSMVLRGWRRSCARMRITLAGTAAGLDPMGVLLYRGWEEEFNVGRPHTKTSHDSV